MTYRKEHIRKCAPRRQGLWQPPLWLCLLLDAAGCVSYFLPVWGEWMDMVWAPLAAVLFYVAFGGKTGTLGALITFAEELLPYTDILPVFTLGWFVRRHERTTSSKRE